MLSPYFKKLKLLSPSIFLISTLFTASPALAGSSQWFDNQGGRVRLVINDDIGQDALLRGAIEIKLKEGWKTYWLDPGDAGVPPSITLKNSQFFDDLHVAFPAPDHFSDSVSTYAGYKHSTAFALTMNVIQRENPMSVSLDVFLGVCKEICIPVPLTLTAQINPALSEKEHVVERAFAALPKLAKDPINITIEKGSDHFLISLPTPKNFHNDKQHPELFIASEGGWVLGVPKFLNENGAGTTNSQLLFSVPISNFGKDAPSSYILKRGNHAIEGALMMETSK